MKRFFYSTYTKAFAVILFLASLTLGVLFGIHGAALLNEEEHYVYDFGTAMEDCYYLQYLVHQPDNAVRSVWYNYVDHYQKNKTPEKTEAAVLRGMEQHLNSLQHSDRIEYYVNYKGTVFTNADITDPNTLTNGLYTYYSIDEAGNVDFRSGRPSYYSVTSLDEYGSEPVAFAPLTVATRIVPDYVNRFAVIWDRQESILYTMGIRLMICAMGLILSLIYLICVCGRDATGNRKAMWTDRIWAEFHLAFMGAFGFGALYLSVEIVDAAFRREFPMEGAYAIPGLLALLAGGVILCAVLSMIRNVKAGLFAKRCVILILLQKLLSWLWTFCKATWRGLRYVGRTLASVRGIPFAALQIGLLLVYTVATLLFTAMIDNGEETGLLFLLLLYGAAAFFLARKGKDMGDIQKGTSRIRNGDLTHRIPEPKTPHLKSLAEDVNQIAGGLDASLAGRMKAERMKTELITNVSHDLKTPLTSIITYTELLSKVEGLPEEARDYISIIGDKSQRLKNLTQDLFAISKVQSGNEEVNWELLDAAVLLEQSLAEEQGDEFFRDLQFCLKAEEGLTFMADGRKLSRVMGNLIQNAVKYAMPGTRVFLSAYREEGRVLIECKNVSAYPLDFSPEEVLGRFVRGDSSRSTEGNGLGLPIAKSYTELCGGDFNLMLDGDLFKVLLSFPVTK